MSYYNRTTNGDNSITADLINATNLYVSQNTVLNNLTVTGSVNLPGTISLANINCTTLTASSFIKAKNNTNEYALLQTTSSADPDPNQCILSTSTGSQGLDIITLGVGKKIQLISDECHMVAGYAIFPALPAGISLFSNSLITLDAVGLIDIRAAGPANLVSNGGALTLTGKTTASLTATDNGLTLSGKTSASLEATTGGLSLTGNTTSSLTATTGALTLTGKTTASLEATDAGLTLKGKTAAGLEAISGALTLKGNTTASLEATGAGLTLKGKTTELTSTTGSMTFTAATTATLTSASVSLTGASTASLTATTGALTLQGGAAASLTAGAALTLGAVGIATLSSSIDVELTALVGLVKVRSLKTDISSSIVEIGSTTGNVSIGSTLGGIALTTGAGAIALTTGIGGMSLAVVGGAITMSTTLGQVSLGTMAGGSLKLFSGNNVQILSNAGNSTGGIYLNTSASNGVSQAYDWRFPSGPGAAGQVLMSQGSSSAQTWANVVSADANNNISANNFFSSSYTISTSGTYNMTAASPFYNLVTATVGAVEVFLPNATTLPNGAMYYFNVNGTSTVNVKRFGSGTVVSLAQGSYVTIELLSNATTAGTWDYQSAVPSNVTWNTSAVSFPQTLTSTNTTLAGSGSGAIVTSGGVSGVNCWMTSDYVIQNGSGGSFVSIRPANAIYPPFNFTLPTNQGASGQVLTSAGTGNAMVWTTPAGGGGGGISSVGMSVPAFLSVSPANITSTGTFAVTFSGSALPVANGGTGVTTSTGSGANVLGTSPSLTSAILTTSEFRGTAFQQAAFVIPAANNDESSLFFFSQLTNTGGRWSVGHNVGGGNPDTFSIYSTTANAKIIELSTTRTTIRNPITCTVAPTTTMDNNFFAPNLAQFNAVNLNFGTAISSRNCGVIQFVNTGGTGSINNSINMGIGVNCITIKETDTAFFTPCVFFSTATFQSNISTTSITSPSNLFIGASTTNNRTLRLGSGSYQNGGIYLNAQTSGNYTPLPANERGSTNIGNDDLGNCLFVAANQEKYLGNISANGVVNISTTSSNNQFMTFYQVYPLTGIPYQAVGSIALTISNGTVYNTSSDYRLKENIEEMPSMFSLISSLRPVVYNFKQDTSATINHGFIAHEVETLFPEAVTGQKDAVDEYGNVLPQQLSYASFTPILTKAVQELISLVQQQQQTIENLTQRITLLESL